MIDDADEARGACTADNDATESENEALQPDSSTDTDGHTELPLAKELQEQLTAFRAAETAAVAAAAGSAA
eukprot:3733053-Rhodomonas_salina.1